MKKTKIKGIEYSMTVVRQDLLDRKLSVPVGNEHYGSDEPLPYRWTGEDGDDFQVFYKGKWQYALSIDFEFD